MLFVEEMLSVEMSAQADSIVHLLRPCWLTAARDDAVDKLLYKDSPFFDPLQFTSQGSRARDTFSFESTDFVGADTLGKPHGSGDGNVLGNTMIEEHFTSDAVGDGPTQPSQWHIGVGEVLEPCLSLSVGQSNPRRRLEGGRGGAETHRSPLVQHLDEEGRQYAQTILVLQAGPQVRASDV